MADSKISALTLLSTVNDSIEFAVNDAGVSKKITKANLFDISGYTELTAVNDDLEISVDDAGTSKRITKANFFNDLGLKTRTGRAWNPAARLPSASRSISLSWWSKRVSASSPTRSHCSPMPFSAERGFGEFRSKAKRGRDSS